MATRCLILTLVWVIPYVNANALIHVVLSESPSHAAHVIFSWAPPTLHSRVVPPDTQGIDTAGLLWSLNPFCEVALEEALLLRQAQRASEVVAVTIGPAASADVLRTALALGADRACHIVQVNAQSTAICSRCPPPVAQAGLSPTSPAALPPQSTAEKLSSLCVARALAVRCAAACHAVYHHFAAYFALLSFRDRRAGLAVLVVLAVLAVLAAMAAPWRLPA